MEDYEQTIVAIRTKLEQITTEVRTYSPTCIKCGSTRVDAAERRDAALQTIAEIRDAVNLLEGQLDDAVEEAIADPHQRKYY